MRVLLLLILIGPTSPKSFDWDKATIKSLLIKAQRADDTALADVGGAAYSVPRKGSETNELYAKRVLRTRDPDHPNVKKGQWLLALVRQFYADAAKRCKTLSRFETNRDDRRFFDSMAAQAEAASNQIASELELVVEGLEGFVEPLPIAKGAPPQVGRGAMAMVRQQKIVIENLDRVTFEGHQPPASASRTARGSLREVFSAQKQYNVSAQMLGRYERKWRKNRGHVRIVIPAVYPALYLNEIARGGVEAKMHTAHLMVMTQRGDLRELELALGKAAKKKKKKKKKAKKEVEVSCPDEAPMQDCVRKIAHAATLGRPRYVP